ncbi:methyltransferase domain-containing protein [Lunatibacter salilacus]|uniref:methyltransferase domain-containing protein n=1 Tax=Lunatibacter salilacus TaxID=2483804 RepID=UPI00131DC38D|nr:methyltransferase domain-containing protein [Lunatibacter salilacus]
MPEKLSERISTLVHALPLYPGIRVLEVGCGPGAAARAVAGKIGNGFILAIDRSEKAIGKAISNSQEAIKTGKLSYRIAEIGKFQLENWGMLGQN